jgi:hypothetical protein
MIPSGLGREYTDDHVPSVMSAACDRYDSKKHTAGGYTLTVSRTTGSGVPDTKHDWRCKAEPGASSKGREGGCIAGPRVRVEWLVRRLNVGCLGRVVAADASLAWLACPAAKPTPRLLIPRNGWNEDGVLG